MRRRLFSSGDKVAVDLALGGLLRAQRKWICLFVVVVVVVDVGACEAYVAVRPLGATALLNCGESLWGYICVYFFFFYHSECIR